MNRCVCGYPDEYHELGTRRCPGTKSGKFRQPPPVDTSDYLTIMRRDSARRAAAYAEKNRPYVPEVAPAPLIPARPVRAASEIAGYGGRQALGLGRRGVRAGWLVAAFYALAADGSELSAVKLRRGDLRAVATWRRLCGHIGKASGWSADIAYAWRQGQMPAKVSHTDLEGFIG